MKRDLFYYAAVAAICAAWMFSPWQTQARDGHINLSVRGDAMDSCSSLEVRSNGAVARADASYTLPAGASLQIDGGARGNIKVRGWDKAEYQIQACRMAAAATQAEADQMLKSVSVGQSGSRFSVNGAGDGEWQVYFLVRAPRAAALDLETRNGPISVADLGGSIKTRAGNGPVSIQDCNGEIQVRATNGPISFAGSGGNVSLNAHNGPISLRLYGAQWSGQGLEARTTNGPLTLSLPDTYHSGVRIETSGHAPVSCRAAGPCAGARRESSGSQSTLELNGSNAIVRLSTENGPVSVRTPSGSPREI